MVCSNLKFKMGDNLFSQKQAQNRLWIFNASSERPLSKLSENHKMNVIGPTELKLWPFKDAVTSTCIDLYIPAAPM